jgi:hypothetical protein
MITNVNSLSNWQRLAIMLRKILSLFLVVSLLVGCSTSGGIYKKDDAANSEFSAGRTILTVVGVLAAIAAAKGGGGGGNSYVETGYAWDYQPGNLQWVCRDKSNGQYANLQNCNGLAKLDNWP